MIFFIFSMPKTSTLSLGQEVTFIRQCCNALAKMGGYVIHENENAKCTLIATGSEVDLAFEVNEILGGDTRIDSIPCFELLKNKAMNIKKLCLGIK
jgi:transketolase